jgi:hypothetical protein
MNVNSKIDLSVMHAGRKQSTQEHQMVSLEVATEVSLEVARELSLEAAAEFSLEVATEFKKKNTLL